MAVYGMAAHCFLVVTAPVTAQVMMTLSPSAMSGLRGDVECDLLEDLGELFLVGRRQRGERVAQRVPGRHLGALGHLAALRGETDEPDAAIVLRPGALDQTGGLHAIDDAG